MFWDNYVRLCAAKGIKPNPAAAELGMSSATVTRWKNGVIPRGNTLQKIADYFGVTVNDLLADATTQSRLSREEGVKVAVLSYVGAGIPLEAINTFDQDDPDSWEEISNLDAQKGEYFALRIRGQSMEPLIRHGDIVIVRRQKEFNDGDIVVALINGDEGVCKLLEYRNNGGIALMSLNPDFPPMNFTAEEIENKPVRIMGRCVERRGKL